MLVVVSLILLTEYFGESPSSPLHTLQRGIAEVFSPIQQGASTVLSPVRDVGNWFSDTFKARSQVGHLKNEVHSLQRQLAQAQYAESQLRQLRRQVGLDASQSINAYHPVAANVISRDAVLWYQRIEVDKGSDDGVRLNDPVIGGGGLVGEVTVVGPSYSIVTLITDHTMAVAAQVENRAGDTGVLVPAVGDPNHLVLQDLPTNSQGIKDSQLVVTVGFKSGHLQDLYPPGIPVGQVSNFSPETLANNGQIKVTPVVDLRHLDSVQILTSPHAGAARAQVP
ncbi:MAG: rod shape-determining protein MreC [Solirubrobacteraceae bacterium]